MKTKSVPSVINLIAANDLPVATSAPPNMTANPPAETTDSKQDQNPAVDPPLTHQEKESFERHKTVIRERWRIMGRSLVEIGASLAAIKQGKLYRSDYATFEDFCRQEFEMGRAYINRAIQEAELIDYFKTNDLPAPEVELHLRYLIQLLKEKAALAWQRVREQAREAEITGKQIQSVVREMRDKPLTVKKRLFKKTVTTDSIMPTQVSDMVKILHLAEQGNAPIVWMN